MPVDAYTGEEVYWTLDIGFEDILGLVEQGEHESGGWGDELGDNVKEVVEHGEADRVDGLGEYILLDIWRVSAF